MDNLSWAIVWLTFFNLVGFIVLLITGFKLAVSVEHQTILTAELLRQDFEKELQTLMKQQELKYENLIERIVTEISDQVEGDNPYDDYENEDIHYDDFIE